MKHLHGQEADYPRLPADALILPFTAGAGTSPRAVLIRGILPVAFFRKGGSIEQLAGVVEDADSVVERLESPLSPEADGSHGDSALESSRKYDLPDWVKEPQSAVTVDLMWDLKTGDLSVIVDNDAESAPVISGASGEEKVRRRGGRLAVVGTSARNT